MKFGGFDWDSGNPPKCISHGVSLAEIEALFRGDLSFVRDAVVGGERRMLGFGNAARCAGFFASSLGEATEFDQSARASCMTRRSSVMSKKFPELKSDDEADAWLQGADLTGADLTEMKKVGLGLRTRKTLRSACAFRPLCLGRWSAPAANANMPTQRLIRMLIEAQLAQRSTKAKRKAPSICAHRNARPGNRAA